MAVLAAVASLGQVQIEHDVAVARNLVDACGQLPAKVQGAGEREGVGQELERMAQVDDEDRFAGIELALQLFGLEAGSDEFAEELRRRMRRPTKKPRMPRISSAPEKRPAQSSRLGLRLRASPKRRPTESKRATQRVAPMPSKKQEAAEAHAVFAGNGRGQRGQAGNKLGDHEGDVAAAAEGVLGVADAGGGLER